MNCDDAQEQLSTWFDGDNSEEVDVELSRHLQECTHCAQAANSFRELHQRLQGIAPSDASINRLKNNVLQQWRPIHSVHPVADQTTRPNGLTFKNWQGLLAVAMTLAVAVWVWRQVQDANPAINPEVPLAVDQTDDPILPIVADSAFDEIASVVQTTGTVEVKYLDRDDWVPVSLTPFACPSDASVRTGEDSLCEVETIAGGIVRLDEHATVRMCSADQIELETGRVWCKAPGEGTLQLTPALAEMPVPETIDPSMCLSVPVLTCAANCSVQAELTNSSDLQVHAVDGLIDFVSDPFNSELNSGEAVQIIGGRVDREYQEDAIIAMRWMLPLLATNPAEVEAFTQRILATIGGAKTNFLYEADLVELGEPGAVPLLAFLQSTDSFSRVEARQTAARVLSQTAGESMTGDLIDLLSDADPYVRVSIASALLRITGEDQGRSPEEWSGDLSEVRESLSAWQAWRER